MKNVNIPHNLLRPRWPPDIVDNVSSWVIDEVDDWLSDHVTSGWKLCNLTPLQDITQRLLHTYSDEYIIVFEHSDDATLFTLRWL